MSSPRWQQLVALYHEARALAPEERAAHVRARAGGDESLEREVAALLEHPVSDDEFLKGPAIEAAASLVGASPSLVGRRLGVYQVQELIGSGGMGEVYRAHDSRLGRDVAIKVLPPEWSTDRDRLRRFANEARTAAALNHPHICTIYDVGAGESGDPPFIAMELLQGETLQERLTRGPVEIKQLIDDGIGLAAALEAAHGKHVLHRDIKPANIFLVAHGAKILDFGLAKGAPLGGSTQESRSTALTTPGWIIGTVAYMSPEQLHGEPLDGRSDVFSLGLVLYEMATGRPAFTGATPSAIAAAILHTQPIAPRQLRAELTRGLEEVILKAIEKDRDLRYQTAADLRADLKRLQRGMSAALVPTTPANALTDSRRPGPWRLIATVAGVLVLLAGLAVWSGRIRRPDWSSSALVGQVDGPHRLIVLPFDNISRQSEDQWLAGAFADSLMLGLRDAKTLVLVNSAREVDLSDTTHALDSVAFDRIIKTLGVRYYVNGSYQRVGDDLRVVARLVNAGDRSFALQESLTDRFSNLLALQDELARRFATALDASPAGGLKTRTSSLAAFQLVAEANDLYLAGRYQDAIDRLQRSLKEDDKYADAWALLGKSYGRLATPFYNGAGTDAQRQALTASLRAVALNPNLYEAQVSLALAYLVLDQYEPAVQSAQRAIDLNPRLPEAYEIMGNVYSAVPIGPCARRLDPNLAESLYRKALELDPLYMTATLFLAAHIGWSGRTQEMADALEWELRNAKKDHLGFMRGTAAGLLGMKRLDEAETQLREIASRVPPSVHDEWVSAGIALMRGDPEAENRLAAAVAKGPVTLREIDTARLYGDADNPRMAAVHLDRLFRADPSCTAFIEQSPAFVELRKHAVIQDVIRRYRTP